MRVIDQRPVAPGNTALMSELGVAVERFGVQAEALRQQGRV